MLRNLHLGRVQFAACLFGGGRGMIGSIMTDANSRLDPILLATLRHVAFDGWSAAAMAAGARDAGLDRDRLSIVFPGGLRDLAAVFSDWADRSMVAALEADRVVLADLRVRERIEALIVARLTVLAPHREAVRAALGFLALPQNADLAFRLTASTANTIWRAAGDTATDFSYYTKRGLLASVLAATMLYWLDDRDEAMQGTRRFLRARIDNVIALQGLRGQVQKMAGGLPDPVRLLRRIRESWSRARMTGR